MDIGMESSEHELMTIAREFDKRGCFILLKRISYKNGKKRRGQPIRFQESVSLDSVRSDFLEFVTGVFPQTIKKFKTLFRIQYFSIQAVELLKSLLPYLDKKKRQAEIIIEFASLKNKRGQRLAPEVAAYKIELHKELEKERAKFRREKKIKKK